MPDLKDIKDIVDSRIKLWGWFTLCTVIILAVGLYFFQVVNTDKYVSLATRNRLRFIRFPPARGEIFDRNGAALALNETTFNIMGYPMDMTKDDILDKFAGILFKQGIDTTSADLLDNIRRQQMVPYRVVTVASNLAMTQMAEIVSDPDFMPQLFPMPVWRRIYPAGNLASLITGYVGEISENELRQNGDKGYLGGDIIGKNGVEKSYEDILRGIHGQEAIEVDARGRRIKSIETKNAVPGRKINLTLDLAAQIEAFRLLDEEGYRGAIVVMDVRDGAIIVMASSPSFDNNPLAWGISSQEWNALIKNPHTPMLNRAISGSYPPASTFKALIGLAALSEQKVTPKTTIHCPGSYTVGGRTFRCWNHGGHGSVNMLSALQHSCDVYFYQVGMRLGIDNILKWTKIFGLGAASGLDMPGEAPGNTAGRDWKRNRYNQPWYPGDTVNYSIGQGYITTTPLQNALLYATIANGGHLVTPYIVDGHSKPPVNLNLNKDHLALIQRGLFTVVRSGTGSRAGAYGLEIAGKTGTAEIHNRKDNALFVAYAPAKQPVYTVSVMIEEVGSGGGRVAAPIAGQILAYLLNK
ncbi:MAG: penicillin-binding protein 2 [Synergistaceae bacterium]|nr:penicillin-binding protein 2 [Synergistaceae bacterium]